MNAQTSITDKIKLFIAKAERTNHEAERDTFMAAAEKLMLKHGIELAMLQESDPSEIVEIRIEVGGVYKDYRIRVMNTIANALGLRGFSMDMGKVTLYIFAAHAGEAEMAEAMIRSLDVQAMDAMGKWGRAFFKENAFYSGMEKYKMRREFILGFGGVVKKRLVEERREAVQDATQESGSTTSSMEIVLASKAEALGKYINEKYNLRQSTSRQSSSGSYEGRLAGATAGAKANIGAARGGITATRAISR